MQLNPADFNQFLAEIGQLAGWRKAYPCPCRDPRSGAAAPGCPQCYGLGTYWDAAVEARIALTGQKSRLEWAKLGLWESGDLAVTLPSDSPAYAAGQFDRFILSQSTVPFSTILRPGDRLRGNALSIDSATWFVDGSLVTGDPPGLDDDNGLVWASPPPDGAQVALTGRRHPEYFVLQNDPQDRAHHGGRDLPRLVQLRLFDLFGRG